MTAAGAVPATIGSQVKGPCARIDLFKQHVGLDLTKMYPARAPADKTLTNRSSVQVVGQLLYGAIIFLLLDTAGNGAYQVAVLSLLVTRAIGLWLVWPVRDDLAGWGEVDLVMPPERLAPASATLEPPEIA